MSIAVLVSDPEQNALVAASLAQGGMTSRSCKQLADLHEELEAASHDLLVLALSELGARPTAAIRELRTRQGESPCPILVLCAPRCEEVLADVLRAGADDYLLMPFRRAELLIRARVLLRRAHPERFEQADSVFGSFRFDPHALRATTARGSVELTRKEIELALLLFRNLGRPLSRAYLLELLWPEEAAQPTRTLDTHISRVRNKLRLRPENGYRLGTVYGYGYLLETLKVSK